MVLARSLAVLAVLACISEAALRLIGLGEPPLAMLDHELEYTLVASRSYHRWGNEISINRHGMRAPDLPARPAPGSQHVLVLGDSVIYGNHLLDQSETIPAHLGALLSQPKCTVHVLPLAVSSWGPVNQAAALKRFGTFDAAHGLLVVSAHDLYDVPYGAADLVPYRLKAPWGALHDAVISLYERVFAQTPAPNPLSSADRASLSLAAMDQIAAQFAQDAIPFTLVYHPSTDERRAVPAQAHTRARADFERWAQARHIPFLDLTVLQPARLASTGYRDGLHPNALGAAAIAQTLAQAIAPPPLCQSASKTD